MLKRHSNLSRTGLYFDDWLGQNDHTGKNYMSDDVLGLTAQIVSAHVTRNAVSVEDIGPG